MNKQKTGFTIIEVVLVLAIAGLIFMMVFLALPALQRSQRDTQRKSDVSRLQDAIAKYQGSHRGKLPATGVDWNAAIVQEYITGVGDQFVDPSGPAGTGAATNEWYNLDVATDGGTAAHSAVNMPTNFSATQNTIYVRTNCRCEDDQIVCGVGNRKAALLVRLEGGGVHCVSVN